MPPILPTESDIAINVAQAIQQACANGLEPIDAQLLLLYALKRPLTSRAWLFGHSTDSLDAITLAHYTNLCARRSGNEPLGYIVGNQVFFGLELNVDSRVLVPRADTEILVEWALEIGQNLSRSNLTQPAPKLHILDLGTGSGAIALALAHSHAAWQITAIDASMDALNVARANAQNLGLNIAFLHDNWLAHHAQKCPKASYQIIVSNPPYIAQNDPHLAALHHEPSSALVAGQDGLDDIRCIIAQAPAFLAHNGSLLLEHGYDQATAVRALLTEKGFTQVESRLDLAGIERCSGGIWQK